MAAVSLKLLVDKEQNRVVFAESDKDFVDILFSFLTLPMGTIIRLLDKQSSVRCMDKLYESVENLDAEYLETEACKTMLLQPRSVAEIACEDLKIITDDLKPRRLYRCPEFVCFTKKHRLFSLVCGARCCCGKLMDESFEWERIEVDADECNGDGVFVKGSARFIISDDLHITPVESMSNTLSLLQKLGITNARTLEKRVVDVSRGKSIMVSQSPLTDVFLREREPTEICTGSENLQLIHTTQGKSECDENTESKLINLKVLYSKITKKVLFAQAREDFVDILFSFLTLLLGSIVKLLEKHSSVGSLDNLYESVEHLAVGSDYIKSEECKNMLLAPKLYPHFCCGNQVLKIEEKQPKSCSVHGCETCFNETSDKCKHGRDWVDVTKINPKLANSGTQFGGRYANRSVRFMVTEDMVVTPLSPLSGIDFINESETPISSLVEKEVTIGEAKALNLLRACLISRTALSDVFLSPKQRRIL